MLGAAYFSNAPSSRDFRGPCGLDRTEGHVVQDRDELHETGEFDPDGVKSAQVRSVPG